MVTAPVAHLEEVPEPEIVRHRRFRAALVRRARSSCGEAPNVETEAARSEGRNLQQAARDGDVLQELHHLVLIAEIAMKEQRRGYREGRQE